MGSRQAFRTLPGMVLVAVAVAVGGFAQNPPAEQVSRDLRNATTEFTELTPRGHVSLGLHAASPGSREIDSLLNFSGQLQSSGVDDNGKKRRIWKYNMAGRSPQEGGTTIIDAPIVPVSLDLLNYDGNGHTLHDSVVPFILPTVYSPIFQSWTYSSSDMPTQIIDAELRAEFYNTMKPNW